jgi:hypothetical protein
MFPESGLPAASIRTPWPTARLLAVTLPGLGSRHVDILGISWGGAGQRGEPDPIGRLVTHPADVAAQYRVLVPESQQLSILRQVRAGRQYGQAEYPAN